MLARSLAPNPLLAYTFSDTGEERGRGRGAAATCALRRARCSAKQGRGGGGGEFTSLLPSSLPRTSLQTDQVGEELRGGKEVAKTCSVAKSGDDGRVSDKKYRGKKSGAQAQTESVVFNVKLLLAAPK